MGVFPSDADSVDEYERLNLIMEEVCPHCKFLLLGWGCPYEEMATLMCSRVIAALREYDDATTVIDWEST